ncbi:MAG: response regulator [Gammaproteobacteria bacterium]|nr:response regulator [Gammaproteobacteria bacterium]
MPYLFSYPTTTLLVDDNEIFLSTITAALSAQHLCIVESNPVKALQIVNQNKQEHNLHFNNQPKKDLEDILAENDLISQSTLTQEFVNLSQLLNRQQKITTIILDHDMPEMDGFLFARNLCKEDISIIMLTGKASHELAVEAFNRGIIDKFLLKDSPNLKLILSQHIEDAKHNFFYKQTRKLAYNTDLYTLLFSTEFSKFFSKIIVQYKVTEYYLLNTNGSYLFITEKNEPLIFTFMPESELNYYKDIAEGNNSKRTLIEKLNAGFIPCFYGDETNLPITEWHNILCLSDKLIINNQQYYFSVRHLNLNSHQFSSA